MAANPKRAVIAALVSRPKREKKILWIQGDETSASTPSHLHGPRAGVIAVNAGGETMKWTAIAFVCLLSAGAYAAPEDDYFAARDAAIGRIAKLDADSANGDAYTAASDKENAALEALLRTLIGPVVVKGFPGPGKLNLESLSKSDMGYGTLDGLAFASADGKASLVATTAPILRHWLVEHQNWWEKGELNPASSPEAAFKSNSFYTQAISTDAAFNLYAELAIAKPAKADLALALLDARSQDGMPEAPDEIIAVVISAGRTLIAVTPLQGKMAGVAACTKIDKAAEAKIQAADDANVAADRKNDALAAKLVKLRTDAETAFRSCFQDKARSQRGFAAAQTQAQALIDSMAR
jgi:hypothetical protein